MKDRAAAVRRPLWAVSEFGRETAPRKPIKREWDLSTAPPIVYTGGRIRESEIGCALMISIDCERFALPNGLDVILSQDRSLPVAAVNVWYHVGSKNEEPGKTGFAHLFEHVMFEGSKNHDASYFDPLQKVGANLNGSTTPDRTNYWENVPSNCLELALWLESDRMGFLLEVLTERKLDVQRDVVKNERRQNYENRPYGMAPMLLQPALFPAPHPYNWTTIGSPEDLDNASLEDVKSFFKRFYTPNNASLAIAGDFDADEARALVERYFGDIPAGPDAERVGRADSALAGTVEMETADSVQLPRLYMAWPTVPAFSERQPALDALAAVLGDGRSSRLYKRLVYETRAARDVRVYHHDQEIAGEFMIQATANPGHSLDELEAEIRGQIRRIAAGEVDDAEIQRAKNRIQASHVFQLERFGGFGGRADQLNYYNVMAGDPEFINRDMGRYEAVTADDASAAARSLGDSMAKLAIRPRAARSTSAPSAAAVDRSAMPAPAVQPPFAPPFPTRTRLANGLNVLHIEKRGLPAVAFGLAVKGGAARDPDGKAGLAHLTASMLAEGTKTRSSTEIAAGVEFLGSHMRAEASREHILVVSDGLASTWRDALEIMADVCVNPSFPDREFERVRANLLTDLRRVSDSPANIAARAARGVLFGAGTPYGHPITGYESSVEATTTDDLRAYFGARFDPSAATLMFVGDISADEAAAAAERAFGGWRGGADSDARPFVPPDTPPPERTAIYLADKPGAAQSVIRAGHLTVPRRDPRFMPMQLMNYIFGGQFGARLNMNLRQDKGYSYGYMSSVDWSLGPSPLIAGGGVQTAVTKEAVAETLKEFERIRGDAPITDEEFTDAVDGVLRSLPSMFETQHQIIGVMPRMVVHDLPDDYFVQFPRMVSETSLNQVRAAAEMLDAAHLKIVIAGDAAEIEPGLRELDIPIVRVDYEGRRV